MRPVVVIAVSLLSCISVSVLKAQGKALQDGGDDNHGPLYNLAVAPWLKGRKSKKKENNETKEDNNDVESHKDKRAVGAVLGLAFKGLSLITRVKDMFGTVLTLKNGIKFIMQIFDPSGKPTNKKDIGALKTQLDQMNKFMKSGFEQLLAGQEFLQVITVYSKYVDHLDYVVGTVVPEFLGDGEPKPDEKDEFIKEVMGGEGAQSTKYALVKVNKMIEGSGYFGSKDLYTALAEKMARCNDCDFHLNGMPLFASQFNTLQAGAYAAYMSALEAKGEENEALKAETTMKERLQAQLKMLASAQKRYTEIAGTGHKFMRLRSARGGCLSFEGGGGFGYHLKKCDDASIWKWRIDSKGGIRSEKYPDNCVARYGTNLAGVAADCDHRDALWHIDSSNADPRYFRIRNKREPTELCITANVYVDNGTPKVGTSECASVDDDDVLDNDEKNNFWEVLSDEQ